MFSIPVKYKTETQLGFECFKFDHYLSKSKDAIKA